MTDCIPDCVVAVAGGRAALARDARELVVRSARRRPPRRSARGTCAAWCPGSGRCRRPARAPRRARAAPASRPSRRRAPRPRREREVALAAFSPREARLRAAQVVGVEVVERRSGRTGSRGRAASRRRSRCRARGSVGRTSCSTSRVHSEYSVCTAVIGCTAWARADRLRRRLAQPDVAHLALRDELGQRADGLLDRRRSGRCGAGSRGRCGRCRGASASPRSSAARSPACRRSRAPCRSVGGSSRMPNLVAMTPRRGGRRARGRAAPRCRTGRRARRCRRR